MPFFEHDDLRLHYVDRGEGPPVVLVPGNTAAAPHFAGELQRLSPTHRAVALDLRGTGRSTRLQAFGDAWMIACADDVAALIDHIASGPAVVMGVSGGALIALLCAARRSRAVRAVVADSFTPVWTESLLRARIAERASRSELQERFWSFGHGDDWASVVDADTRWMERRLSEGGIDITDALPRVSVPVLLTGTLGDEMVPDVGERLMAAARSIPSAELYVCGEGGHPLAWTAPDRFWSVCGPFLRRVTAAPAATEA
jgi:pimeloyl-ACP methyl ester carboxylesterase